MMFLLVLGAIYSQAAAAGKPAAADNAELQVLAARRAIVSGELRVESVDYVRANDKAANDKAANDKAANDKAANDKAANDKAANDKAKEKIEFIPDRSVRFELSFEGDRSRSVIVSGRCEADGSVAIFDKVAGLRAEGRTYVRRYDLKEPEKAAAVSFASIKDAENWLKVQKYVVDPRLIGLQPVPFGILHSCEYEEFVAHPTRSSTRAEDALLDNMPVRLVTFQNEGNTARMWISPKQGWNLLKSEIVRDDRERVVLACELEQFGDVWFPKRVTFEHFDKAGKMIGKNVTTVLQAKFNVSFPPEHFTLASLEPVKGSMVFDVATPARPVGHWDGEQVSRARMKKMVKASTVVNRSRTRSFVLAASVGLGLVLLVIYYRRSVSFRRTASAPTVAPQ